MPPIPNKFVIFDTEYTSWEGSFERGWSLPHEHKELVQIGAIKVSNMVETESLQILVKPGINPDLSEYFINLTGITQESVDDEGLFFREAYKNFMDWRSGLPAYSYGGDEKIFEINHQLYKTGQTIPTEGFFDVRENFKAAGIDTDKFQSGTIPRAFGEDPPSRAHDALSDARSILIALKCVYTRP